jgi:hypothetical protein
LTIWPGAVAAVVVDHQKLETVVRERVHDGQQFTLQSGQAFFLVERRDNDRDERRFAVVRGGGWRGRGAPVAGRGCCCG